MLQISLKNLRERKHISQYKLADDIGVAQSTVGMWESGRANPPLPMLEKLAEYFGVSVDHLLGRTPLPTKFQSDNIEDMYAVDVIPFPIIGEIRAGYGGLAEEVETGDTFPIPTFMLKGHKPGECFLLRVKGDSMYPKYMAGDLVLILRCSSVDSGEIAVMLFNGEEASLKEVRYVRGEDWFELRPINPMYPPIRVEGPALEECKVLGKPIGMIRT